MITSLLGKGLLQCRDERVVASCETARSHYMHIIIDRLSGNLIRSLEETTDINIEA